MTYQDLRPLRRAMYRHRAKRKLRKIAVRTSYTLSALCFVGAAIVCGESNYPELLIVSLMALFIAGMMGFYKLGGWINEH